MFISDSGRLPKRLGLSIKSFGRESKRIDSSGCVFIGDGDLIENVNIGNEFNGESNQIITIHLQQYNRWRFERKTRKIFDRCFSVGFLDRFYVHWKSFDQGFKVLIWVHVASIGYQSISNNPIWI